MLEKVKRIMSLEDASDSDKIEYLKQHVLAYVASFVQSCKPEVQVSF